MNSEHDEPERLAWTWDGEAKLRATRAKWLAERYHDVAIGRFDRIATVMRAPRQREIAAHPAVVGLRSIPAHRFPVLPQPRRVPVPQARRLEPWSAYSVAVFGASFPQPGDPDFVPGTAWQALEHSRAMTR
jgi:hypothetical protein